MALNLAAHDILERVSCRVCQGRLESMFSLGNLVRSDFLDPFEADPPAFPLDLCVCQTCDLVQLRHTVHPDLLYRRYWYRSGINETMVEELKNIAEAARSWFGGSLTDHVVCDIGANDGTLLGMLSDAKLRIAVEPAENLQPLLAQVANLTIPDYFPGPQTAGIPAKSVSVVTSIACFYDVEHPLRFVAEVDRILTDDGVWIVQFQDLDQMIAVTGYDNICHEHLCYYSGQTFTALLQDFDLGIARVGQRLINGGSLRITVRRRKQTDPVPRLADREKALDRLDHFAWRVHAHRDQLQEALALLTKHAVSVDLYAASTKSSTLLQYCGIDTRLVRYAVERSPEKVGKVTSGTRIPIIDEQEWRRLPAPVTLVGAWQFRDAFLRREQAYLSTGGSFLFPLPQIEVITGAARQEDAHA